MNFDWLQRLKQIQEKLLETVANESDQERESYKVQYHHALSPVSWHIGHCAYVETLWIRGWLLNDYTLASELETIYRPDLSPKHKRSSILPELDQLISWASQLMEEHRRILECPPLTVAECSTLAFKTKYLAEFLINHHAQHLETISIAKAMQCQLIAKEKEPIQSTFKSRCEGLLMMPIPGGIYKIGSGGGFAYDNELPQHSVTLKSFKIAKFLVKNSEFLAFIEDGGYQNQKLWPVLSWEWRKARAIKCPRSWCFDRADGWSICNIGYRHGSIGDRPVIGVTYHEASAFASWAGKRLAHEYEWEAAAGMSGMSDVGKAWEWCSNALHPYHGFAAYPYQGYSVPWFDHRHYVLRGGSQYTEPEIGRISYRNYYVAHTDYLFSGIRLAE